ncbi:HNH endonuclease [Frankia sp. CNm7]|uniref:HNH endonuclease n=2 Tax=Frankia nepalensis TaxID=1836974 RepID=A0A937RN47_9ACTN|nr:HNH endonuclease [Frankia nepalensis]MBL7513477.1 HNH endonuclease [Frankia nepalensis]MBL7522633.1 HNH endonuclease [Frankia nepalensis]MBL7630339.1 HNH endonuclease [Frankia nepalensis]
MGGATSARMGVAVSALALAAGPCQAMAPGAEAPAGAGSMAARAPALTVLDALPVRGETAPGYHRDLFEDPRDRWPDVDRNGCDTRNDVLFRDLRSVTRHDDGCRVTAGELSDPYTGNTKRFASGRDTSGEVEIDHVVSLANAWRTGAFAWPHERRVGFANDPANLLAVERATNREKSDQDAASWLPPAPGLRCPFVARQVGVKERYGLWVTPTEASSMRAVLATCPGQPALGRPPAEGG